MSIKYVHTSILSIECPDCNENRLKEDFIQIVARRDYGLNCDDEGYTYFRKLTKRCKYCRDATKEYVRKRRARERAKREHNKVKICRHCRVAKHHTEFVTCHSASKSPNGYQVCCKSCCLKYYK